ncbi:MAG: nucleoside recognition domain-containing protein [Elusimicrobiota bacterium]|nr:spore maturation protein [Endomicrobiia bacterium]MDW8165527.1 nucleoside recognition domain-containing protein [Elusimicrobiota bacterium]
MNTIWFILIAVSAIVGIFTGKAEIFTKSLFEAAKSAVEVSLFLLGIISLWLGITKIIEDSGLVYHIAKFFKKFISRLFPNIPKDHPSITSITLNFLANLLGLGNAATPLGIKAMHDLQTLNEDKETISFEMMLFIVINTASIQLIPFTVVGVLSEYGAKSPDLIVLPTIIATFLSALVAVINLFIFKKFLNKK